MTVTLSPSWMRAMERARAYGVKPVRRPDGTFRVSSKSEPGKVHIVLLDDAGHIIQCTECKGWESGGRQRPCWHAGAVALAKAYLDGHHLIAEPGPVESTYRRSQIFRAEVGA